MSENYMQSMDELRECWSELSVCTFRDGEPDRRKVPEGEAEFDRIIAAHDAKLREQIAQKLKTYGDQRGEYLRGGFIGPVMVSISKAIQIVQGEAGPEVETETLEGEK